MSKLCIICMCVCDQFVIDDCLYKLFINRQIVIWTMWLNEHRECTDNKRKKKTLFWLIDKLIFKCALIEITTVKEHSCLIDENSGHQINYINPFPF